MLQLDAEFAPVHSRLSELHANLGELAEAIRQKRIALRLDPDNGYYLRSLAGLYLTLGDFEAVDHYRSEMKRRLDPDDWRFVSLELHEALARNDLVSLPAIVNRFSSTYERRWYFDAVRANTYLVLNELDAARGFFVSAEPDWENPLQWPELIGKSQTGNDRLHGCKYAGILLGLGEDAAGKELLRQTVSFELTELPNLIGDAHRRRGLGWCYLAAARFDDALTFYESRIEHGHYSDWYMDKHLPWWDEIREAPRYIAMVEKIDEKIEEQRELLRQIDAMN